MNLDLFPDGNPLTWPFDLARLLSEKDHLEGGLANCATYLHALRKKHARNERRLMASPSLPRKKRKKIQHNNRELQREIENRERDEQAFLNNLQACKANIYVATTLSCSSTTLSSTVPKHNSSSTNYSTAEESEPTESSWNGWTNEAAISPFQKRSNNPFFLEEIAPGDPSGSMHIDTTVARPLLPYDDDDGAALPVPPNTAQSHHLYSTLSPEAPVFQPYSTRDGYKDAPLGQPFNRLSISPTSTINGLEHIARRRATDASFNKAYRQMSLHSRPDLASYGFPTWCYTTPEQSPSKDDGSWVLKRNRTISF